MKCINCNLELKKGAKVCEHCGTKAQTNAMRCPKCFVKLNKGTKKCPKCGCDIQKTLEEAKKPKEEKKKLTKKQKITVLSSIILSIALIFTIFAVVHSFKFNAFKKDAKDYAKSLEENTEIINMLAEKYNNVYDGQWLTHTERSIALEKKFKKEIDEVNKNRDKLRYYTSQLSQKAVNKDDKKLVKTLFKNYDSCYVYVIGKNGKYPGYMDSYKKVHEKYEKTMKEFKKRIK